MNQHYKYVKILVHGGHNENKYYKCKKENELILWYIYDTSLAGFVNPEEYNQENKDGENAIALAEGIFKKKKSKCMVQKYKNWLLITPERIPELIYFYIWSD